MYVYNNDCLLQKCWRLQLVWLCRKKLVSERPSCQTLTRPGRLRDWGWVWGELGTWAVGVCVFVCVVSEQLCVSSHRSQSHSAAASMATISQVWSSLMQVRIDMQYTSVCVSVCVYYMYNVYNVCRWVQFRPLRVEWTISQLRGHHTSIAGAFVRVRVCVCGWFWVFVSVYIGDLRFSYGGGSEEFFDRYIIHHTETPCHADIWSASCTPWNRRVHKSLYCTL